MVFVKNKELLEQLAHAVKTGGQYNLMRLRAISPLRPGEYALLSYLWDHRENKDGVKISDISRFMNVTPPTVTPIVSRMEKQGFIRRVSGKCDRRVVNLFLTEEGIKTLAVCNEKRAVLFSNLVDMLGEDDTRELIRILNRIAPKEPEDIA